MGTKGEDERETCKRGIRILRRKFEKERETDGRSRRRRKKKVNMKDRGMR